MINDTTLEINEYKLYARHLILPQIQVEGQKRLKKAKILFIGAGGLASAALMYLVASGIGQIGIVDDDCIEISNLQRQVIYEHINIGKIKTYIAQEKLQALNPNCQIDSYNTLLSADNAISIIEKYDIVMDASDNFKTRNIISQTCIKLHKVYIYGAILEFKGQVSVFNYQGGPQFYDLYHTSKQNQNNICNNNGVLGVVVGLIGLIQATEAIKIITGVGNILNGYTLNYNSLTMSFEKIKIRSFKQSIIPKYDHKFLPSVPILTNYINIKDINTESLYIVDVRNTIEYSIKHIQGAINIPLQKLKKHDNLAKLKQLSEHRTIAIYCNNHIRQQLAASMLDKSNIQYKQLTFHV